MLRRFSRDGVIKELRCDGGEVDGRKDQTLGTLCSGAYCADNKRARRSPPSTKPPRLGLTAMIRVKVYEDQIFTLFVRAGVYVEW
jgi:hypothetical protein